MTLQKQTLYSSHALILALLLYAAPLHNTGPAIIVNEAKPWLQAKPGWHLQLLQHSFSACNDSTENPAGADELVRPRIRMNAAIIKFVKQFRKKNELDLKQTQKRSKNIFNIIEPILTSFQVPIQLKYLAVVESDLKSNARSHAGAVGPWQLMTETARELGLKVNGKIDERKNYSKSTKAAAKYLKALYQEYNDWLLVIAAYNSGPGVVNSAIRKSGSRNFWKLQQYLAAETRGHVKRYIAVHYFFEEAGSETTLTKAENIAYGKELEQYNQVYEQLSKSADTMTTDRMATNLATNKVIVKE